MLLEFRTKRDNNGNCKYLAIDTTAKTFSRFCKSWISKDIPLVRAADIETLHAACIRDEYKEV